MIPRIKQITSFFIGYFLGNVLSRLVFIISEGKVNWEQLNPIAIIQSGLYTFILVPMLFLSYYFILVALIIGFDIVVFIKVKDKWWPFGVIGILTSIAFYVMFWVSAANA